MRKFGERLEGNPDTFRSRRPTNSTASRTGFKTRPCDKFERDGVCPNGPDCAYAHGKEEYFRRTPSPDREGSAGFTHRDRMSDRRRRHTGGDGPSREDQLVRRRSVGRNSSEAITVRTVDGIGGSDGGRHVTSVLKTKICFNWEARRYCSYGSSCFYAHGQAELRSHGSSTVPAASREPVDSQTEASGKSDRGQPFQWSDKMKEKFPEGRRLNGIYGNWIDGDSPRKNLMSSDD